MLFRLTPSKPELARHRLAVERVRQAGQRARPERQHVRRAGRRRAGARRRARASRRRPAGGARARPAARAAGGCSRASRRRRGRSASVEQRRLQPTRRGPATVQDRAAAGRAACRVATWSLRLRAVCSRPATSPTISRRRASTAMWMSSSATSSRRAVASISARTCPQPGDDRAARRPREMMPCRAEHPAVGDRRQDVLAVQAPVEGDRGVEAPRPAVGRLAEAPAPQLHLARTCRLAFAAATCGVDADRQAPSSLMKPSAALRVELVALVVGGQLVAVERRGGLAPDDRAGALGRA